MTSSAIQMGYWQPMSLDQKFTNYHPSISPMHFVYGIDGSGYYGLIASLILRADTPMPDAEQPYDNSTADYGKWCPMEGMRSSML